MIQMFDEGQGLHDEYGNSKKTSALDCIFFLDTWTSRRLGPGLSFLFFSETVMDMRICGGRDTLFFRLTSLRSFSLSPLRQCSGNIVHHEKCWMTRRFREIHTGTWMGRYSQITG